MKQIRTAIVEINPKKAVEMLTKNKHNRKKRPGHVAFLARAMRIGSFETTHQGIAFDDNGDLVDGQHRLYAIVESNTTQTMLVTYGVSSVNLDNGLSRTMTDLTGKHPSIVAVAGIFNRVVLNRHKPLVHEVEIMIDSFSREFSILDEMKCLNRRAKLNSSPITAAATLRLYEFYGTEHQSTVQSLVRSLCHGELVGARPIILSFYKQLMVPQAYGGSAQHDLFARSYSAFSPHGTDRSLLKVVSIPNLVGAAREVFHTATAENFR